MCLARTGPEWDLTVTTGLPRLLTHPLDQANAGQAGSFLCALRAQNKFSNVLTKLFDI